jgi:type I restriction enzyme S subunit
MGIYKTYKNSNINWLGDVPEHWILTKYKHVINILNGFPFKSELFDNENGFPLIRIRDITSGKIETFYQGDFSDNYIIKKGDLIIGMDGDFNIRWWDNGDALLNQRCCSIKTKPGLIDLRFLYYLLPFDLKIINDLTYYTTVKHLSNGDINNRVIALAPIVEQIQIARFLDYQTGIINDLLSKKEKFIELLKEQRRSIINEAITKGLNSNSEMKDSGIEWLGQMPLHWDVARIGHYSQIIRGASPRPAGDLRYFGGDYMPWITVGEVTNGNDKFLHSTENYLTKEGSNLSRIIYPETLLLSNSGATLGVPKISKITGCINDGSVAFVSFDKKLERDFLYYFFITHTEIYRNEMSGYGQPNLNTDIIKSTKFPLPPIEEQIQIIQFIENKLSEFDNLLSQSKLQIEKLKEYRQSIISEAVTGKVDVRDWEPPVN